MNAIKQEYTVHLEHTVPILPPDWRAILRREPRDLVQVLARATVRDLTEMLLRATLRRAAALHAWFWNCGLWDTLEAPFDTALEPTRVPYDSAQWNVEFLNSYAPFVDAYSEAAGVARADGNEWCNLMGDAFHTLLERTYYRSGHTLIHGWLELDQLVYPTRVRDDDAKSGESALWSGWWNSRKDLPMMDIARLVVTTLPEEDRQRREHDLLAMYHTVLHQAAAGNGRGVEIDYSLEDCQRDYLSGLVMLLYETVIHYSVFCRARDAGELEPREVERLSHYFDHVGPRALSGVRGQPMDALREMLGLERQKALSKQQHYDTFGARARKAMGKSKATFIVRPFDDKCDWPAVEARLRAMELPGLEWTTSSLQKGPFGLRMLRICAVVDDENFKFEQLENLVADDEMSNALVQGITLHSVDDLKTEEDVLRAYSGVGEN